MQRRRNVIVIHSPHSGRSAMLSQVLAHLQHAGVNIAQVITIADLDKLPAQGRHWQESGIDLAIAAGGDGLVGGVISHIAESGLPLGILPLGTANDIARSLHIPLELSQVSETIISGKLIEVDIGIAQPAQQAPHLATPKQEGPILERVSPQKHGFFAHALTVGFNVQFARLATNIATRLRYGRLTYPVAALEVLKNHEALEVELHFEGLALPESPTSIQQASLAEEVQTSLHCRALQTAVINAPIFGGQWQLAVSRANMSDRLLDIIVLEDIELGNIAPTIEQFLNSQKHPFVQHSGWRNGHFTHHPGELTGIPGMHHLQARGVTITTSADPRDVTLDGEIRGQTPMRVCLANERLRVLVPASPM